jgi:hypothetical protein
MNEQRVAKYIAQLSNPQPLAFSKPNILDTIVVLLYFQTIKNGVSKVFLSDGLMFAAVMAREWISREGI